MLLTDPQEPTETASSEQDYSVLLVEDNAAIQQYLAGRLRRECVVLTASNGAEALEILHNQAVDLVVSDIMMPGMDGMELPHDETGGEPALHPAGLPYGQERHDGQDRRAAHRRRSLHRKALFVQLSACPDLLDHGQPPQGSGKPSSNAPSYRFTTYACRRPTRSSSTGSSRSSKNT